MLQAQLDQRALFIAVAASTALATFLIARRVFEGRYRAHRESLEQGKGRALRRKRDPYDPKPRTGYLSWDDYFMAIAFLSAQRSKDPNKQVGACIVGLDQIILGIGYNGFPRGVDDKTLPWAKMSSDGSKLQTKYPYVVHAEANAILNAKNTPTLAGAIMYVTMFPCNECAKLIIQAGIKEVVFYEDKNKTAKGSPTKGGIRPEEAYQASRKLLSMTGVELRQHKLHLPLTLAEANH